MKTKTMFFGTILLSFLVSALSGCSVLRSAQAIVTLGNRLPINDVTVVTGEDKSDPDLIIVNRKFGEENENSTALLSYTMMKDGMRSVKWEYDFEIDAYPQAVEYDDSNVYTMVEDQLYALDRAEGGRVWKVRLSDEIPYQCDRCIQKIGERLVVMTGDRMLYGIDVKEGKIDWEVRLNAASAPSSALFDQVKDKIALLDYVSEDDSTPALFVYDPETGDVVDTYHPACGENSRLDMSTLLTVDPTSQRLYLVMGNWGDETCVQSWDLSKGEMVWDSSYKGDFGIMETETLLTPQRLYVTAPMAGVDLKSGEVTVFPEFQDYDLRLLSVHGDRLIALAKRTRGSTRYEIWGMDSVGEVLWKHELEVDDEDKFQAQALSDGVIVLQELDDFDDSTDRDALFFQRLDWKSGEALTETRTLTDIYWSGTVWTKDSAYLTLRNMDRIDLTTGKLVGEWPMLEP